MSPRAFHLRIAMPFRRKAASKPSVAGGAARLEQQRGISRAVITQAIEPELLTAREAAVLLGTSLRQFYRRRTGLPAPVLFSERAPRWRRGELLAYITAMAPVTEFPAEPGSLASARASKGSTSGDPGVNQNHGGGGAASANGEGRPPRTSNPELQPTTRTRGRPRSVGKPRVQGG
jgi:predicted DNA-binding transcriptional regulator AlpA